MCGDDCIYARARLSEQLLGFGNYKWILQRQWVPMYGDDLDLPQQALRIRNDLEAMVYAPIFRAKTN